MHQFKAQPSSSEDTVRRLRGDLGLRSARKPGAPQGLHFLATATRRLGAGGPSPVTPHDSGWPRAKGVACGLSGGQRPRWVGQAEQLQALLMGRQPSAWAVA